MFNKIMQKPPRCPLCLKPMENAFDTVRRINILVCHRDEIAIAVTDPLVGRWEEKREKIPCPSCNADMRIFATSVGFMKAKCPKKGCGCTVKGMNVSADTKTMAPALKIDGVAHS